MSTEVFFDDSKLVCQRQRQGQTVNDLLIAFLDLVQVFRKIFVLLRQRVTAIQHIRYLCVLAEPFARCTRYNVSSGCFCMDDFRDLFKLLCARKGTAPEFYYFSHGLCILLSFFSP